MSTENSAINLPDFTYLCRYCGKSYQLRIDLFNHKWKDHQDEIRRVKPKSSQNMNESSQLDTLKNKRKAEETRTEIKKFANGSKYPADGQLEEDEEVKEEDGVNEAEKKREYHKDGEFLTIPESDTNFFDDEMEIDIQEEEFFQCSTCGLNFLTLDNLRSHEPECDNEIKNNNLIQPQSDSELDTFGDEEEVKVNLQEITFLKRSNNEKAFEHQEQPFKSEQVDLNQDDDEEGNFTNEIERKSSIPILNVETKVDKLETENVQLLESSYQRPKLTSNCIIALAIKNSPAQTVTSYEVMKFAAQVFPYFQYAVNPKWKNTLYAALYRSTLFKKINTKGKNKGRLLYGFDPEPKSKLRIEKITQKEVLNNEEAIKSCMRRPEDFSSMVSGDLRILSEEEGGDKEDHERENEATEQRSVNENEGIRGDLKEKGGDDKDSEEDKEIQSDTLQDFGSLLTPSEIAESQSFLTGDNDDIIFVIEELATDEYEEKNHTKNIARKEPIKNVEKKEETVPVQLQPQSSYQRPKLSLTTIAALAIMNSPTQTVTCNEVVEFATNLFPYFENTVNHKWKVYLRYRLNHCIWFRNIETVTGDQNKTTFVYEFDLEPASQLLVKNLIQNECLNNEEAIKSCMRRPEDFTSLVKGDLCMFAEEEKEDGKDEKEQVFENLKATDFKVVEEIAQDQIHPQSSYQRPNLTFICIAALAIKNSPTQILSFHDICKFTTKVFPYFENAVNHNWPKSMLRGLKTSKLFMKIEIMKHGRRRGKICFRFDSEPESQLGIQSLIRDQCSKNEASIKSCMRRPEDFSSMVSGDLCILAEGLDQIEGRNGKVEEEHSLNETPPANTFKVFDDYWSGFLKPVKLNPYNHDEFQVEASKMQSPIQKTSQLPLQLVNSNDRTFELVSAPGTRHRPAILRRSKKAIGPTL